MPLVAPSSFARPHLAWQGIGSLISLRCLRSLYRRLLGCDDADAMWQFLPIPHGWTASSSGSMYTFIVLRRDYDQTTALSIPSAFPLSMTNLCPYHHAKKVHRGRADSAHTLIPDDHVAAGTTLPLGCRHWLVEKCKHLPRESRVLTTDLRAGIGGCRQRGRHVDKRRCEAVVGFGQTDEDLVGYEAC